MRREELVQRVQSSAATTVPESGPSHDCKPYTPPAKVTADPMVRLSRHVLGQRRYVQIQSLRSLIQHSFYPLFPPSSASQLPLDLSHSRLCMLEQVTPDLMLLPSNGMKPFVRMVDSTMIVNPGVLVRSDKQAQPSAFAQMQVEPMPLDELRVSSDIEANELVTHKLYQRARMDLVYT